MGFQSNQITYIQMIRQLNTGIFPYTVHTFTGTTEKAKQHFIELTGDVDHVNEFFTGRYSALCVNIPGLKILIHFLKKPTLDVVVHEFFHAVEFALGNAGIKYSEDSCEVYAYLLEHLVKQWIQK